LRPESPCASIARISASAGSPPPTTATRRSKRPRLGWSLVMLLAATVLFFAKLGDNYSRLWLGTVYGGGLARNARMP
jgi:hypothetical protein